MRVSFAGALTKDTGEAKPRPVARKTPSRQFSSDSNVSSDADLASNVYRSLSLTVSEADDETMASKRGALEVEKLLLEAAVDDKNSDVVAARRCSARLREVMLQLDEVRLAEEALAECNARPRAMSTAEKRAAEKRRLSRRQSRNEGKRGALEVEKLLLEAAVDDKNSDVVAARRCSARLREVMLQLEEVRARRRGPGGVQQQPHRRGEARGGEAPTLAAPVAQRGQAPRADALIVPRAPDQTHPSSYVCE
jgi:hypothetical protein